MVSKIGLFLLCKSGSSLFATGWSYSSERLFYIKGMGRSLRCATDTAHAGQPGSTHPIDKVFLSGGLVLTIWFSH